VDWLNDLVESDPEAKAAAEDEARMLEVEQAASLDQITAGKQ
jgi:hypothetical protein